MATSHIPLARSHDRCLKPFCAPFPRKPRRTDSSVVSWSPLKQPHETHRDPLACRTNGKLRTTRSDREPPPDLLTSGVTPGAILMRRQKRNAIGDLRLNTSLLKTPPVYNATSIDLARTCALSPASACLYESVCDPALNPAVDCSATDAPSNTFTPIPISHT